MTTTERTALEIVFLVYLEGKQPFPRNTDAKLVVDGSVHDGGGFKLDLLVDSEGRHVFAHDLDVLV